MLKMDLESVEKCRIALDEAEERGVEKVVLSTKAVRLMLDAVEIACVLSTMKEETVQ